MSMNIPKTIIDICQNITVNIDTRKLGPRQIVSVRNMAMTGILNGRGSPWFLAKALRREAGLATVHYIKNGYFAWFNMPKNNEDFFNRLHAISVAMELKGASNREISDIVKAVNDKQDAGRLYCDPESAKQIMKTLELPKYTGRIEGVISIAVTSNTSFRY